MLGGLDYRSITTAVRRAFSASGGGASLVAFLQSGVATLVRSVQSVLDDRVSILAYIPAALHATIKAGTDTTDLTPYVQAFLNDLATQNRKGYAPRGIYSLGSGLSLTGVSATKFGASVIIEGEGSTPDGDKPGTTFKWIGTDNVANILLALNGIYYFEAENIALYGDYKVGQIVKVNNAGGGYAPSKWLHKSCHFQGAKDATAGGKLYYVTGTTNCDQFRFTNCRFVGGGATPSDGYVSDNQNAVLQDFSGSHFDACRRNVWLNGGGFSGSSVNFTQATEADLYLQVHDMITLNNPWSEQSRKFVIADNREQYKPLVLNNPHVASFPWSWWKISEGTRTQPTNDYTQWIAIDWDRPAGLILNGGQFTDPFNGAVTGAVAPTTAQTVTVRIPNTSIGRPVDVVNNGSVSQNAANSFTKDFLIAGAAGSSAAMRMPFRKRYVDFGNLSGAISPQAYDTSLAQITMTGDVSVSFSTVTGHENGDEYTLIFKQDGTGGRKVTSWANCTLTGGTFTPDPTASSTSMITFFWNGSTWVEKSRSCGPSQGSATYDPANLADGAGATTTVTVTGAALGDFAEASFSLDLQGITLTAWVSAANTVSVRFQNESGGALDLASGTLRARVRKP